MTGSDVTCPPKVRRDRTVLGDIVAFIVIGISALLAACTPPSPTDSVPLETHQAYLKTLPQGASMTAAYGRFSRPADATGPLCITHYSTPSASSVELHNTVWQGNRVRMEQVPELCIEPGTTQAFEPGGMHLMLHGLAEPPTAGAQTVITFHARHGGLPPADDAAESAGADGLTLPVVFDIVAYNAPTPPP